MGSKKQWSYYCHLVHISAVETFAPQWYGLHPTKPGLLRCVVYQTAFETYL